MIRNKNTGKLHADGCPAIGMMNPKNVAPKTPNGKICKWCGAVGGIENIPSNEDDPFHSQPCNDKHLTKILKEVGCTLCNSKHGGILMFPHPNGAEVEGEKKKQWVYFHCYECQYDSNFKKSMIKYELARM
ncbi:MAG: hypothetical protein Q8M92_01190 [Candidatus Subteraquimicrobiales bacterium]|nr:hypothetical protein [Candidatus Subteraquimicrobiales bacterium]